MTVGGTYCVSPNDPSVPLLAEDQAWYSPVYGTDPYLIRYVEIPNPAYTTTTTTVPTECFQDVGGFVCFPIGSPEWQAMVDAGEPPLPPYVPPVIDPVIVSTTTTTTTATSGPELSPAERLDVPSTTIEVAVGEPPVPSTTAAVVAPPPPTPTVIPETGVNVGGLTLAFVLVLTGLGIVRATRRKPCTS